MTLWKRRTPSIMAAKLHKWQASGIVKSFLFSAYVECQVGHYRQDWILQVSSDTIVFPVFQFSCKLLWTQTPSPTVVSLLPLVSKIMCTCGSGSKTTCAMWGPKNGCADMTCNIWTPIGGPFLWAVTEILSQLVIKNDGVVKAFFSLPKSFYNQSQMVHVECMHHAYQSCIPGGDHSRIIINVGINTGEKHNRLDFQK